jgi:hypothetical protein
MPRLYDLGSQVSSLRRIGQLERRRVWRIAPTITLRRSGLAGVVARGDGPSANEEYVRGRGVTTGSVERRVEKCVRLALIARVALRIPGASWQMTAANNATVR